MAFDGITVASLVKDCQDNITDGRIYKIAQPEKDALLLTIRRGKEQFRLLLSASASLPLFYFIKDNRPSPMSAPGFCMLLRKYIHNGRIVNIRQPGLERIIHMDIEHLNELGDLCKKTLTIELMGKHSNLIFCDESGKIIDSIKHVSGMVSSVREVLPGRDYFIPQTQEKTDPLTVTKEDFFAQAGAKALPVFKSIYTSFTGLSPVIAHEICFRAGVDSDKPAQTLSPEEKQALFTAFSNVISYVKEGDFTPHIIYEKGIPVEFSCVPLTMYQTENKSSFSSVSEMLGTYYAQKDTSLRIRQKSADLRKIVQTALERNIKKYDLQVSQMKDTQKKDKFRLFGELLNTYGYQAAPGAAFLEAADYHTGNKVKIPLDTTLSPSENAKKYFDKYGKMKRTYQALSELTISVKEEIVHLESIAASLDIAIQEEDLVQIKEELIESGYIRRKSHVKKAKITSRPLHYISADGFHIYVGKNNFQNDELTFQFATGGDWWFHAKGMPGSHVIVKTEGKELPDRTFEEAGRLAAYYSRGKEQKKVEIDYTLKKNVKKPGGAKPGFVVYYTNYSLVIDADISGITQVL